MGYREAWLICLVGSGYATYTLTECLREDHHAVSGCYLVTLLTETCPCADSEHGPFFDMRPIDEM